jgi:hypothetical protein
MRLNAQQTMADQNPERDSQADGDEFPFLLEYQDEVVAFLRWCTTTISESQPILECTYSKALRSDIWYPLCKVPLQQEQDELQSILFWFLVWKWDSLGSKEKRIRPFHLDIPATFVLGSHTTTTMDAFFALSQLIFSATSISNYSSERYRALSTKGLLCSHVLNRIKHITMLPSRFTQTYLRRVVSFGLSSTETRRPKKSFILENYRDFAILPSATEELTLRIRAPEVPTPNSALEQAIDSLSLATTEAATGCLPSDPTMSSATSTRPRQSQSSPVPVGSLSNCQKRSGKGIIFSLKSNPQVGMKGRIVSVENCSCCLGLTYGKPNL